ncbi:hypothetical protein [Streptomyces sp. NPDC047043]|uniref:hypothetical protein n=1 Tax=Streptomyces sp. NPDC047043 TaxID=3154497 RepID=UPI0033C9139D
MTYAAQNAATAFRLPQRRATAGTAIAAAYTTARQLSIRALSRKYGVHRRLVREALSSPVPTPDRFTFNASSIETGTESCRLARSEAQKNKAAG